MAEDSKSMKGLVQCCINNERTTRSLNQQLSTIRMETKGLKEQLDMLMQKNSVDVLTKGGAKIERRDKKYKVTMNKHFVKSVLQRHVQEETATNVINDLFDNRPKMSKSFLKVTMPTGVMPDVSLVDTQSIAEADDIAQQFGLT